jgi:hypothetical protein
MEKRSAIILRHIPTGLYYSTNTEHTANLWKAWRFYEVEYLNMWLEVANHRPKHPEEYEPVTVTQTIALEEKVYERSNEPF